VAVAGEPVTSLPHNRVGRAPDLVASPDPEGPAAGTAFPGGRDATLKVRKALITVWLGAGVGQGCGAVATDSLRLGPSHEIKRVFEFVNLISLGGSICGVVSSLGF